MRAAASIGPWLPCLHSQLSSLVLLEGKAAELYHLSLMEKPAPSLLTQGTFFGVLKAGNALKSLEKSLLAQGFKKRTLPTSKHPAAHVYWREDLGWVQFLFPRRRQGQKSPAQGLAAAADGTVYLLLESPHSVQVPYLDRGYDVQIPSVGRFVLEQGLGLGLGRSVKGEKVYHASHTLLLILDLLVQHGELEEEALGDLGEIRPPSLAREFRENLLGNGPGTAVWEAASGIYRGLYPGFKAVQLTSWYWKFTSALNGLANGRKGGEK